MLIKVDKAKRVQNSFSFTYFPVPVSARRAGACRRLGKESFDAFGRMSNPNPKSRKRLLRRKYDAMSVLYGRAEPKTMEAGLCFPNAEQPQTP